MNKVKQVIALAVVAVFTATAAFAQTNKTSLIQNGNSVTALNSSVGVGYQNYNVDRGVITKDQSAFADISLKAPAFAGFDALADIKYVASNSKTEQVNITPGIGTDVKIGEFDQYVSATFTKRINSPLENLEADLNVRFTHIPVPYLNSLFTPTVTLAKTWQTENKGIIVGGDRSDTFAVFGKDFYLDTAVKYGHFDNYSYVEGIATLSTKLVGKVYASTGVDYVKDVNGAGFSKNVPFFGALSVKF